MKRLWCAIASAVLFSASQSSAALLGYLSDYNNGKVMTLDSGGTVTPLANVFAASGAALDSSGNLYVGSGTTIQKITPAGAVSPFATGAITYNGHVAFDTAGNLYASSGSSNLISKITPAGAVSTFASGFSPPQPTGLAFDASGNLFAALYDSGSPTGSKVVKITPAGVVTPFASGLNTANGLAFDASGNLFVASQYSTSIYKITPAGAVSTFATDPLLNGPRALAFDGVGNLYSANYFNGSVSKISPAGAVTPFASSGLGQGLSGIAVPPPALPPTAYYSVSSGGAQLVVGDAPRPLQAAAATAGATGTNFPPLLIPPNPNPGKALIQQTGGPDPKKMMIPPGVLARKAAGPAVRGLYTKNPIIWQIRTNQSFSAPAAKFGSAVLKASGRTGAAVATFAGPGSTSIRYTKTAAQFGGPARIKVAAASQILVWGRPLGVAPPPPPCKHPFFGGPGTQMGCIAALIPEYPASVAAAGAPVGFTAMTPGTPPAPPPALRYLSVPNSTGLVAKSAPYVSFAVTPNKATSAGFPWTTGRVQISAPSAAGLPEVFTLTGMDSRVNGVGTLSLVSGSLSNRADTGPNANRGWLRLNVPEPGALVGAAAALGTLAACHFLARRRAKNAGD
jgi:sugar lactone lactonase YvrE